MHYQRLAEEFDEKFEAIKTRERAWRIRLERTMKEELVMRKEAGQKLAQPEQSGENHSNLDTNTNESTTSTTNSSKQSTDKEDEDRKNIKKLFKSANAGTPRGTWTKHLEVLLDRPQTEIVALGKHLFIGLFMLVVSAYLSVYMSIMALIKYTYTTNTY